MSVLILPARKPISVMTTMIDSDATPEASTKGIRFRRLEIASIENHRGSANQQEQEQERRDQDHGLEIPRQGRKVEPDAGADKEKRREPAEEHGIDFGAHRLPGLATRDETHEHPRGEGAENALEA